MGNGDRECVVHRADTYCKLQCQPDWEYARCGMVGPSYGRRRIDRHKHTYAEANGNRVYDLCALLRAHAASSSSWYWVLGKHAARGNNVRMLVNGIVRIHNRGYMVIISPKHATITAPCSHAFAVHARCHFVYVRKDVEIEFIMILL